MIAECATRGCTHTGGRGLYHNFCRRCADRLAAIRTELEAEEPRSDSYRIRGLTRTQPSTNRSATGGAW